MRFSETQYAPRWVIIFCLGFMAAVGSVSVWNVPVAERMEAAFYLVLAFALTAVLFVFMKLETKVDGQNLHMRIPILANKMTPLADIASATAETYAPLRDYGGWGLRFGTKGKMYSMRGNQAVRVTRKSGETFSVGTGKPDALVAAIRAPR